jgi:hypothetical protein
MSAAAKKTNKAASASGERTPKRAKLAHTASSLHPNPPEHEEDAAVRVEEDPAPAEPAENINGKRGRQPGSKNWCDGSLAGVLFRFCLFLSPPICTVCFFSDLTVS